MRDLSIKRNKSFVGCLAKLKVYIEDIYSKDIVINGVPCRKLGELKNGEMKTFQIGEESAKVFVIADKISKGYCNEFYIIPDGDEEVCLTGACKFNPATGNAFQFENNNNEEVLLNRKRNNRKGIIVLIVAALVGLIFGFLVGNLLIADNITQQKTFNKDDISITLNNKFNEYSQDGFFATYATEDVAVFVIREEFSLFEDSENMTIDDYAELVRANNTYKASELEKDDSFFAKGSQSGGKFGS